MECNPHVVQTSLAGMVGEWGYDPIFQDRRIASKQISWLVHGLIKCWYNYWLSD